MQYMWHLYFLKKIYDLGVQFLTRQEFPGVYYHQYELFLSLFYSCQINKNWLIILATKYKYTKYIVIFL